MNVGKVMRGPKEQSSNGLRSGQVPLYGCGGTSEIVVLDTQQVNKGYAASIGEVSSPRFTPVG